MLEECLIEDTKKAITENLHLFIDVTKNQIIYIEKELKKAEEKQDIVIYHAIRNAKMELEKKVSELQDLEKKIESIKKCSI